MNRSRLPLLPALGGLALSAITLGWAPTVQAELPPWVYGQEQRQAPYALELLVRSVHSKASGTEPKQLQVQAQVLQVKRQPPGARLRAGDCITLRYPFPPAALQAGPARRHCRCCKRVNACQPGWRRILPCRLLQPAAGGRSFGPSLEREQEPG